MKIWWIGALGACTLFALHGCVSENPSRGIADDGRSAQRVVFPAVSHDAALRKPDRAVVREKLGLIRAGMHKDQVVALLGTPQFDEGIAGVREWDYLLDFRSGGGLTTCQYKLLFDADYKVGSMRWSPTDCGVFVE